MLMRLGLAMITEVVDSVVVEEVEDLVVVGIQEKVVDSEKEEDIKIPNYK